jgi:hypothetical protein
MAVSFVSLICHQGTDRVERTDSVERNEMRAIEGREGIEGTEGCTVARRSRDIQSRRWDRGSYNGRPKISACQKCSTFSFQH